MKNDLIEELYKIARCSDDKNLSRLTFEFIPYECGLINDFGGGNVSWWMDYIRNEISSANESAKKQYDELLSYLNNT